MIQIARGSPFTDPLSHLHVSFHIYTFLFTWTRLFSHEHVSFHMNTSLFTWTRLFSHEHVSFFHMHRSLLTCLSPQHWRDDDTQIACGSPCTLLFPHIQRLFSHIQRLFSHIQRLFSHIQSLFTYLPSQRSRRDDTNSEGVSFYRPLSVISLNLNSRTEIPSLPHISPPPIHYFCLCRQIRKPHTLICETWLTHMWDMTHSYVRHDSSK